MRDTVIDFHAHAFPDSLAARAVAHLEHGGGFKAFHDGRIASLLRSMDTAGIDTAVLCSIATKPEQFAPILAWSKSIASPRIVPLPSVHPAAADPVGEIHKVAEEGFLGIKIHPYYQGFDVDEERLMPMYRALDELGLFVVCHTGFDFAFPRDRKADPVRIRRVLDRMPSLLFISTHMGAWDDWDEVERHLLGLPVYMDLSLSMELLGAERSRHFLTTHPQDRILFGTDTPWAQQADTVAIARSLKLEPERAAALFYGNAERLLRRSAV